MISEEHAYVLVTGANSGVGFGICCRLIDDFLRSRSSTAHLTIVFTTRGKKKSSDTLRLLNAHLNGRSNGRVRLQPEEVDLTRLLSVRILTRRLLASAIPKLDAIILNAGFSGVYGINYPLAVWQIVTENAAGALWPLYKLSTIGSVTSPQLEQSDLGPKLDEPPLGQVFCANVFGHYILSHWLMPLLRACDEQKPGRVIWSTSLEPNQSAFDAEDLQGVRSAHAYEHSKRILDLLSLTAANQPATSNYVRSFVGIPEKPTSSQERSVNSSPSILNAHPGVPATAIVPLPWISAQVWMLTAYFLRTIGSVWHTCTGYAGAISATWLALASPEEIREIAGKNYAGQLKWGSVVDRFGNARVEVTDVPGWGLSGSGEGFTETFWDRGLFGAWGRRHGATDATKEEVEEFIVQGARIWHDMEELRQIWEKKIEEYELLSTNGH